MIEELYKQNILDHYHHPHHKGVLDPCTVSSNRTNEYCGDALTLFLTVEDNTVKRAMWQGDGCAISVAGASMLLDKLEGMSLREAHALTEEDVMALIGTPFGPARAKCALLAFSALKDALTHVV